MKRALAYYGSEVLKKKSQRVEQITPQIRELFLDMFETMDAYRGIGLAAPQVHRSLRLFVARLVEQDPLGERELSYEEWLAFPCEVFINPEIVEFSGPISKEFEACLSLPGIKGRVARASTIHLEALDGEGKRIERHYSGYLARVVMHEIDHLDGILYIDHLSKGVRKQLGPALKELEKTYI